MLNNLPIIMANRAPRVRLAPLFLSDATVPHRVRRVNYTSVPTKNVLLAHKNTTAPVHLFQQNTTAPASFTQFPSRHLRRLLLSQRSASSAAFNQQIMPVQFHEKSSRPEEETHRTNINGPLPYQHRTTF